MDTAPSYHVIFSGKLREGFELSQVQQAFAERLKLPREQLDRLFSGKPQVIKRTHSPEEAKKLATGLAKMGAVVRIQTSKTTKPAAEKPAATPKQNTPASELPKFSPYPKGGKLISGLILAAATEVFFDLLYLLMLLACSVGLLYYNLFTTWGSAVIGFGPLALLVQMVTLLFGLLLLFLIAKPLLSFSRGHRHGIQLTPEQEPDLYAFVEEVCKQIGAIPPQVIRINNDIAVGLGYQRGPLGFVLNRHVLTIGTPLAAATDTSQLAALIAQSLQLFNSKSLSPRAAFLLRSSDSWLQRAIYGQDTIDRTLANLIAEKSPLAVVATPLQQLIALSRKALGWRLVLSRQLNRRLVHRLVADADKVSLVFSGSTGFSQLIEQQRLLAFASQNILPTLNERWNREGSLPENLVQAMVLRCKQYPPSIHEQLRTMQEKEKAACHDTIPSDRQRLRRVSKMNAPAAYPGNSPATKLFRSFDKLAKTMTLRLYYNRLGIPVSPNLLIPATVPDKQLQQQLDAIFQQLYRDFIPLKLRHRIKMVGSYEEATAQHAAALDEIASGRSHAELALKRCVENAQALIDVTTQELMYRADLWRQWGVESIGRDGLEHIHQACRDQEQGLDETINLLARQLKPYVQRLATSLALLDTPAADEINNAGALHKEVTALSKVLERIEQSVPQLQNLHLHTTLLRTLLSYNGAERGKLHDRIQEQAGDIQQLLAGLGANLKTTPYPFDNDRSHKNLMAFALRHAHTDEGAAGEFDRGNDVVEQIIKVQRHILGRLCTIALHVEKELGL